MWDVESAVTTEGEGLTKLTAEMVVDQPVPSDPRISCNGTLVAFVLESANRGVQSKKRTVRSTWSLLTTLRLRGGSPRL